MHPPHHHHSRINLAELKAQIVKKLGPDGSKQYFHYLNRFLSLKLNKDEFNNLCLKTLGRENIPLHNHLIRSILKNACTSKTPPPSRDHISKPGIQINCKDNNTSTVNGGDMLLPISPKKARTGLRDRKSVDRRSSLGLNGKTNFAPPQPLSSKFNAISENGVCKSSVLKCSTGFSAPSCSEQDEPVLDGPSLPRSPIRAPLGVPFCPVRAGGARRAQTGSGGHTGPFSKDGILWDSVRLRERMENIALAEGLEGVSLDSADLLNHGLDSYMRRLIRSCVELVGPSQRSEVTRNGIVMNKQCGYQKLINGIRPGYHNLVQSSGKALEVEEQRKNCRAISLRDFRVAMELNPQKLGEDWPLLLEKICINAFEE
ncbi:4-hydroxy-3-methylbut-2-en-1-yl diphosphatesynthase [Striga asiatica]|uniref:4-hydroxy-3-methylbut-2-en-1-yl diphosphatesynthase n=1 Tax=Striga asiatica TaxID=4170 RepID=A0A5A7QUU9_STRAF|nr:4-hydroxy-3-methylbut-2-en-1-yl diphosphatesynthase [Striga asiatica]